MKHNRFAVTFHRTRRNASRLRSELDQISGIGEKTTMKLLRHFGSVEAGPASGEEELAEVAGRAGRQKIRTGLAALAAESPSMNDRLQTKKGRRFPWQSRGLPDESIRSCTLRAENRKNRFRAGRIHVESSLFRLNRDFA